MANLVYDKARQKFLEGGIAWLTDTIKAQLVDTVAGTGYAVNITHEFLSSVPGTARISAPQTLASKTSTNGNADAGDLAFPAVTPAGTTIEAFVIYKDTGNEATSPLICYIDTATGLPITANGGTINILFNGTKIFRI
jgi:hypothetical protein